MLGRLAEYVFELLALNNISSCNVVASKQMALLGDDACLL